MQHFSVFFFFVTCNLDGKLSFLVTVLKSQNERSLYSGERQDDIKPTTFIFTHRNLCWDIIYFEMYFLMWKMRSACYSCVCGILVRGSFSSILYSCSACSTDLLAGLQFILFEASTATTADVFVLLKYFVKFSHSKKFSVSRGKGCLSVTRCLHS